MDKTITIFLTTDDLMARWKCKYTYANTFMHRKGSGAIRIGKRLLITLSEVEQHEATCGVRVD
jgi:hypothetical protein